MKTFGLIGYPLSHSFSKRYFSEKFDKEDITGYNYELFPLESIDGFSALITANVSLCGLNVTIPHKVAVIPFLDELDPAAKEIGAVNCISIIRKDAKPYLKGYNTDAAGFENSLKPLLQPWHNKALVFGNGGAAKAVQYVLAKLGIDFIVVSRNLSNISQTDSGHKIFDYQAITGELLHQYPLLINTTPLGMYPNAATAPSIPYQFITPKHLAYDLVYNPEETLFLEQAKAAGAVTCNGLEMLRLQAEESWYIWNNYQ